MKALTRNSAGTWHEVMPMLLRIARKALWFAGVAFRQPAELVRLLLCLPAHPRVLIIEPNNCHAEVVIGIGKYFMQLGYNCQFLVSSDIEREKPFCRMPEGRATAHYLMYPILMRVVTSRFLSLYDFALVTSSSDYRKMTPFLERYRFERQPTNGMLFIEHDFHNLTPANQGLHEAYEAKRLLVLTNYRADEKLTEIAPCHFGDVKTRDTMRRPVIALVPGTNARDLESLIQVAKALVERGRVDFELRIVGTLGDESAGKLAESMGIGGRVALLGRVNFPKLYQEVEQADFVVGPQDVKAYLNRKTSGSKQLSIGFLKPLILPDELAAAWGLGASTCISYAAQEGLAGAMERALLMRGKEYGQLVDSLRTARSTAEQDSVARLGTLLAELARAPHAAEG